MPIVTPILMLNVALLLAFVTVIALFADRIYEIVNGERLFISADAAPQALRVSVFLMTALVLIVMGFFSWESYVISARERNLLQAEQELRQSEIRLSKEKQAVTQLPLKIEALKRAVQAKRAKLVAVRKIQESELEAASAEVKAAGIERNHLTNEDVSTAEAFRDKARASVEVDVVSEYEARRLELEANIASLRAEADKLEQNSGTDEQLELIEDAIQAATIKRQSLFEDTIIDRTEHINGTFNTVLLEYREGQRWAESELLRRKKEIEATAESRSAVIESELADLILQLETSAGRLDNSEAIISQMQSEVASLEESVQRVLANIDKEPLRQSSADTALAFRALALGALGAMVTLLISHERAQTGRLRSIFSDKDFFTLFISQMVRGSVVAVSGYAIVFTDILSFNDGPTASAETIPDFWKMTLVCIALGAFAERIYDLVGTKLPNGENQEIAQRKAG